MVIADPPWTLTGAGPDAEGRPEYPCLTVDQIAAHLHDLPAPAVAVWLTWPLLAEWTAAWSLEPTTGGAWVKSGPDDAGHYGPGHWWAGCSEPVLVYRRQGASAGKLALVRAEPLRNAWIEPPREHSRKPAAWMAQWIRRWTAPGSLVVDPYAGLGSVAEAVLLAGEGRRYLGAEISPERHASALSLIAQVRP